MSQYVSGKTVPREEVLRFLAEDAAGGGRMADRKGRPGAQKDRENGRLLKERKSSGHEGSGGQKSDQDPVENDNVRVFWKSTKLDHVLYDVRGPVVEEAERMENEGVRILKLNIGNPAPFDFHAPDEVVFDMRRQMTRCEGYSPANGHFFCAKGNHAVCPAAKKFQMCRWTIFIRETASAS